MSNNELKISTKRPGLIMPLEISINVLGFWFSIIINKMHMMQACS